MFNRKMCGGSCCCNHCFMNPGNHVNVPLCCPTCPVRSIQSKFSWLYEYKWNLKNCNWKDPPKYDVYKKWYESNQYLIYFLSKRLKQSPERIQFMLIKLEYSNYGPLLQLNGPQGACYYLPLMREVDNENKDIFDSWGDVLNPMDCCNLMHIFRIIRDYIIKKFNEAPIELKRLVLQSGQLSALLPSDDPLLNIFKNINMQSEYAFNIDAILKEILVNPPIPCGTKTEIAMTPKTGILRGIEDLYFKVNRVPDANPVTMIQGSPDSSPRSSLTSRRGKRHPYSEAELLKIQRSLQRSLRRKMYPPSSRSLTKVKFRKRKRSEDWPLLLLEKYPTQYDINRRYSRKSYVM